ncbi:nuclear transport factor 2 family protein [Bradyrhizobium sp. 62B]|uniref:nuclear transport factor 2 family protein n=1 Tax=Bradyrhizobium sp. 62B TaxID=2898442 RepID=UPI0025582F1D|nr:nuclear transport factor 2 family protein [Bradyrhizobium sp. 62B]
MSFDPLAAALDWFEAYRAGKIEIILAMYAEDAVIRCGCGGMKAIAGPKGRRAYWIDRLNEYPATQLAELQPADDGALISYGVRDHVVRAILAFNARGQIALHTCGRSH